MGLRDGNMSASSNETAIIRVSRRQESGLTWPRAGSKESERRGMAYEET